ncbi:MAG: acyl carrier protein [Firmicutes bacterium]|nr:acyl carrier protein [Bacillota bacterium]HOB35219.1 acyl carrier protein [Bacillota bacterium]HPZ90153.1 acyl carrier protein [Bacillota bacterium]HQE01099.1 acyl carrier protein [Bacillota bacterium]
MSEALKDKIIKLIADQAGVPVEDIDGETSLQGDLELDSLDIMDLLLVLEEEFDIQIPDEELSKIQTVNDVINYIGKLE